MLMDPLQPKYDAHRVYPQEKQAMKWYFWEWDIFGFGKASIVMTFIGWIIQIIQYDILDLMAWYGFWIFYPLTSSLRYLVYKFLWKKENNLTWKDFHYFLKATIYWALWNWLFSIIVYDLLNLKAWYGFWIFPLITFLVKYSIFKIFWKEKTKYKTECSKHKN